MRNIALDRVQAQMARPQQPSAAQIAYDAIVAANVSPPIGLDELRQLLINELNGTPTPQPVECPSPESIHFENIYDFASWYGHNQSGFSEAQRTALDTILQTRAAIEVGCACKRTSRESLAHNYFNTFWQRNRNTDLLATIAKVTGAKHVSIGAVCHYPVIAELPR